MGTTTNNTESSRPGDGALRWYRALQPLIAGDAATADRDGLVYSDDIPAYCHDLARLEKLIAERHSGIDALDFISRLYWGAGGARLWRDEEFHSNLLAWLLNPNESHGADDYFVKGFLERTGATDAMLSADWSDATVIREWENLVDGDWGYLDILVLNQKEERLLAIENKIFSEEHSSQLTRYRKALEERYPTFIRHLVFLTPEGTLPRAETEQEHWTATSYAVVLDLVSDLDERDGSGVREDVGAFLSQYATTLRGNIVPDTSAQQVAREIYLTNPDLFDMILEAKPDYTSQLKDILRDAIEQQDNLALAGEKSNYLGFVPRQWVDLDVQKTSRNDPYPLLHFGFYFPGNGNAMLNFGVEGGTEKSIRNKIAVAANESTGVFNQATNSLGDSWTRFHLIGNIRGRAGSRSWADPTTREKIMSWVSDFARNEVPRMAKVIEENVLEYKRS